MSIVDNRDEQFNIEKNIMLFIIYSERLSVS